VRSPRALCVGTASTMTRRCVPREASPSLTYGTPVVITVLKYERSETFVRGRGEALLEAWKTPRRSAQPRPPANGPPPGGSMRRKYALMAPLSPSSTGGAWAIALSVASSPLKYESIIAPARITRARALPTALRRASSY
jgi:hypothetical protein